jgi:hypothetical protein
LARSLQEQQCKLCAKPFGHGFAGQANVRRTLRATFLNIKKGESIMKKLILVSLLFCLVISTVASQETLEATTSDGRKVLLQQDGTWSFSEEKVNPIEIVNFNVINRDVDYNQNRYSKDVLLELIIKNVSGRKIRGYKIIVEVQNAFGDRMNTLSLTSGNSVIENDQTENAMFRFEDNQFIQDEVYDNLISYSKDNLLIMLKEAKVIYSN